MPVEITADPAKAAQSARSDVRTRQLLSAALEVMKEKGVNGTSMKEVAEQAGVSTGLIYRYYANKDELVESVITGVLDQMAVQVPESIASIDDPVRKVVVAFTAYAEVIRDNRQATLLTYRETGNLNKTARDAIKSQELKIGEHLHVAITGAIDAGYFRNLNAEIFAYDLLIIAHSWALKYWFFIKRMTFEEFVTDQISLFLYSALKTEYHEKYQDLLST